MRHKLAARNRVSLMPVKPGSSLLNFGTSRWAARRLGYINLVTARKGHHHVWHIASIRGRPYFVRFRSEAEVGRKLKSGDPVENDPKATLSAVAARGLWG